MPLTTVSRRSVKCSGPKYTSDTSCYKKFKNEQLLDNVKRNKNLVKQFFGEQLSWEAFFRGAIFRGDNFPGGHISGVHFLGVFFPLGFFPGGIFPDTLLINVSRKCSGLFLFYLNVDLITTMGKTRYL